ncbi:histidine kinase dimerization/phosphoacceptor domain -containing protein [Methanothermobacter sp.]|uniref:sensor histidine kinase n=1 Tax=Methanothermobacter sp. TaxID=1884223 RepID=UPI0026095BD7|nr:histidine kinase dimerization/phosphoacceptor domain -containing protein [Methanothermobacter sp.]MDI9615060.1 histidine kinase dimerization/phosphoacceptor domain -containing protein [Methanothermobacter sp.]
MEFVPSKKDMKMKNTVPHLMGFFLILFSSVALLMMAGGGWSPEDLPTLHMSLVLLGASIILAGFSHRRTALSLSIMIIPLQFIQFAGFQGLHTVLPVSLLVAYSLSLILLIRRHYHAGQTLAYITGIIAYALVMTHLTGVVEVVEALRVDPIISAELLMAAVGLLGLYPQRGVTEPLFSGMMGGYTARVLLATMLTAITVTGILILRGRDQLPFPAEIFLLSLTVALIIVTITFTAYRLNTVDHERIMNERGLRRARRFFRDVVENLEEAVAVIDEDGNPLHLNRAMKKLGIDFRSIHDRFMDARAPSYIRSLKAGDRNFTGWYIPLDEGAIISLTDITDLMRTQEELQRNIMEKDALLRELHHRVKNNLQIILSLINMQMRSASGDARKALVRTSTRVQTLAAIHESVYGLGSLAEVKMHECIGRIAENLRSVFDAVDVEFHIDARHVFNVETAMPLALIVNELVSNSIQHAFPEGRGTVKVEISRMNSEYCLRVVDDGVGFSGEKRMGLQLALNLARQIEGDLRILLREDGGGTEVTVPFRELHYRRRL